MRQGEPFFVHYRNDYSLRYSTLFLSVKGVVFTDRYVCPICGHVYNPLKGEPLQDIKAGVDFTSLSADWACPVCFASKNLFKKEE
ncbi:rubredoxin [Methanoregula sp.]|uniref:rubredoxin n=1 Tax=Methanoregula sp. TaxID=2052170 RepID=UPI003454A9D5